MERNELNDFLIKNGLKITSMPDHKNKNVDVTIYETEQFFVIVEEQNITSKKVTEAITHPEKIDPKTGTVTSEEAQQLIVNITTEQK